MWLKKGITLLFGAIDYLNLLPFQVFLKRYIKNSTLKTAIKKHRNVPSYINNAFHGGKINAAFISSITSEKCKCTNIGIVAQGKVYSVLLVPGRKKDDSASKTSNILAKLLNLKGEVIIGDRALKYYLDGKEAIDLSEIWFKKRKLPFVFARLCYNKNEKFIQKMAKSFESKKIFIPQFLLKKEASRRDINPNDVRWYLKHINYKIDIKAKKSLNIFLSKSKRAKLI